MPTTHTAAPGLEGVVLTTTRLSAIDGDAGRLSYAGYDIHDLAEHAPFEEVCYLLWHGSLPTAAELRDFSVRLAAERALTPAELELVRAMPHGGHGMDALRTLISALAQLDERAADTTQANLERIGMRIVGRLPALLAAWHRVRSGLTPVASNPELGHAADLLAMLHGSIPEDAATCAMNSYLVLLAEHGLNASTFAARVVISAGADVYAALVAALAALKGTLHGGANELAMRAFLAIGEPAQAQSYVEALLARRERLMGIGHRIYKVEDPRVQPLRYHARALAEATGAPWPAVAEAVSDIVHRHPYFVERRLNPNVEFYSAPLLYSLGLPLDLFTAAFAVSRVAGWLAHIREQLADNRIIRPRADYDGPQARRFVPLERRA
jgi:citrate synthase